MKKLLCPLFALLIVLSLSTAAFAADYSAEESANALYELGLFQGTGETANGKPIYSLDAAPTRAQAVTMLVRLLGKEAEAKAGTWTVPFSDLADWARPYVGYAYANGLTNGLSAERFGSDDKVTANQYLTFILRALGYSSERDFQWDKANAFSDSLGLTHGEYSAPRSFTRGDTARISYAALAQARKDSSETLAAQLVRQGAVKAKTAAEFGLAVKADYADALFHSGASVTFRNGSGRYLAASGSTLTASDQPYAWYLAGTQIRCGDSRTLMLDISNAWYEAGNSVGLCEETGSDAQHWTLKDCGDGQFLIVSAAHPEFALCAGSGGYCIKNVKDAGESDRWRIECVKTDRVKYFAVEGSRGVITMQAQHRLLAAVLGGGQHPGGLVQLEITMNRSLICGVGVRCRKRCVPGRGIVLKGRPFIDTDHRIGSRFGVFEPFAAHNLHLRFAVIGVYGRVLSQPPAVKCPVPHVKRDGVAELIIHLAV